MLHSFNHSCHFIKKNGFARFSLKFPNYNMFCKMSIIMKLAFPPPPLIMLLTGICLIQFFYKLFQSISTCNYVLFIVSYQNTLLKPENPTQGHITSCQTLSMPQRHQVMPWRHQLCHEDINYATKISIMPRRHQLCHEDINPPQRRGAKIPMSQRLRHLVG